MDFNEIYKSVHLTEADYTTDADKDTVAYKAAKLLEQYFVAIDKSAKVDISSNGEFDNSDGPNSDGWIDSVNVIVRCNGKESWFSVYSIEKNNNDFVVSFAGDGFHDEFPLFESLKRDLELDGIKTTKGDCGPEVFVSLEIMQNRVNALTSTDNNNGDKLNESLMNKDFENGKPYCQFSEKDFEGIHDDAQNIVYHGWQKWVQKRNPEPDKLHNKFAKEEKNGIYYGHCVPTISDAN